MRKAIIVIALAGSVLVALALFFVFSLPKEGSPAKQASVRSSDTSASSSPVVESKPIPTPPPSLPSPAPPVPSPAAEPSKPGANGDTGLDKGIHHRRKIKGDGKSDESSSDTSSASLVDPAQNTSTGEDALIESSLARLKQGNLAYATPEKMKSGETAHIVARIANGTVSVATLETGLPSASGTKTETASTPISTKMKMSLKGADFEITALSSEEQIVAGDIPTTWEWDVIPKHAGKLRLHLAATVELMNLSRDFTSIDRDIAVQVDPVDATEKFIGKNLVWILGSLGTAIAAVWAWWKKRKSSVAKPPGNP